MRIRILWPLATALALAAGTASAATFAYSTDFSGGVGGEWAISAGTNSAASGVLGQLGGSSAASATLSQSSPASGTGVLEFDLLLFRTMDGVNAFTDVFSLVINGATRYQAAFGTIAGGGVDTVFLNPDGATFTRTDVDSQTGIRHVTIGFAAVAGVNTFQFSYPNLQSFQDEAWGLDNVNFTAEVGQGPLDPVPEPTTWALMIVGFGAVGAAMRRRGQARTAL